MTIFDEYSTQNDSIYCESFIPVGNAYKKSSLSLSDVYSNIDYEDIRGMEDSGEYDYPHRGE